MSFQRLRYDPCEARKYTTESAEAASYSLNTPVMCGNCFPSDPRIIAQKTGVSVNTGIDQRFYSGPVDVESDLMGVNREASRCPAQKFNPTCPDCKCAHQGQPCGQGVTAGCQPVNTDGKLRAVFQGNDSFRKTGQRCNDNNLMDFPSCFFGVEDTRLSNPPGNIRGVGVNRFIPLILPAQEQIMFPGDYNVPTRTVFKDNHRPCIPNLDVISAAPMPPAEPLPCPLTSPTCAAYTSPMYQFDVCG